MLEHCKAHAAGANDADALLGLSVCHVYFILGFTPSPSASVARMERVARNPGFLLIGNACPAFRLRSMRATNRSRLRLQHCVERLRRIGELGDVHWHPLLDQPARWPTLALRVDVGQIGNRGTV